MHLRYTCIRSLLLYVSFHVFFALHVTLRFRPKRRCRSRARMTLPASRSTPAPTATRTVTNLPLIAAGNVPRSATSARPAPPTRIATASLALAASAVLHRANSSSKRGLKRLDSGQSSTAANLKCGTARMVGMAPSVREAKLQAGSRSTLAGNRGTLVRGYESNDPLHPHPLTFFSVPKCNDNALGDPDGVLCAPVLCPPPRIRAAPSRGRTLLPGCCPVYIYADVRDLC